MIYNFLAYEAHNNPPTAYEAKTIHQIWDEKPVVTETQLKHWEWIASYYMCSLGEVMRAAMPNAFILESETLIFKNEKADIKNYKIVE